jgi:hypothetical protein
VREATMKTCTVKLAATDPFRATFRTFEGVPGRFTVEPAAVELTDDQVQALRGWGLLVEAGASAPEEPGETTEFKGRV